jgi:hypothetical protein
MVDVGDVLYIDYGKILLEVVDIVDDDSFDRERKNSTGVATPTGRKATRMESLNKATEEAKTSTKPQRRFFLKRSKPKEKIVIAIARNEYVWSSHKP